MVMLNKLKFVSVLCKIQSHKRNTIYNASFADVVVFTSNGTHKNSAVSLITQSKFKCKCPKRIVNILPPPPHPPLKINKNAPAYGCFQFTPSTNSGSLVCHQSCLMLQNAADSCWPTFLLSGFSMLAICMIIY